jgi:hypothetical protein
MIISHEQDYKGKLMSSYFVNAQKCLTRNEQSSELNKPEIS